MKFLVIFLLVPLELFYVNAQCDQENVSVDSDDQIQGTSLNDPMECNKLEEISSCNGNPQCQRTCENYSEDPNAPGLPCPRSKSCFRGCVCRKGYVRSQLYGPCIHFTRCPRVRH
ncbi:venom peptide SjAPI-2-like [Cotesia glomerata]|uniref:TIL domain-containing protein n=1 Tax=Cotesia glomerata TaxID=32391 RepID=A0AAV7ICZ8_COTGL|nr:venom peptide SjAPI-2-like [Cotesia glomerata]KAH0549007.1 hypothetical protein KQX54_005091 [Cotesia glomerata]